MAEIALVAATVLSAVGSFESGQAQKRSMDFQAAQLDQNAGQTRASSQRDAIEQRRQATLAQSRLQAVAGGGGLDPTIVNLSANLAGEGEFRALSSLYEGEERARGMEDQAKATRYQGKQAKAAGTIGAMSSLLAGGSKMYENYGGGGFNYNGDANGMKYSRTSADIMARR